MNKKYILLPLTLFIALEIVILAMVSSNLNIMAKEVVASWYSSEKESIQNYGTVEIVSKTQRAIFTSQNIKGIYISNYDGNNLSPVLSFGNPLSIRINELKDGIISQGVFKKYSSIRIGNELVTFYIYNPITLNIVGLISLIIFLLISFFTYLLRKIQLSKLREQQKLNKYYERLAHDIRSPAGALSSLVNSTSIDDNHKSILLMVTDRINSMANNLLMRSKSKLVSTKDIRKQLELLIEEKKAIHREIIISLNFKSSISEVLIELSSLKRHLSNIINNSFENKHNANISVSIEINTDSINCHISDNGTGFNEEILGNPLHIESTKQDGHGLGLNQLREDISAHGGEIKLYNKNGANIEFSLPLN